MNRNRRVMLTLTVVSVSMLLNGCTLVHEANENDVMGNYLETLLDDENEYEKFKEGNSKLQEGIKEHQEEGEEFANEVTGDENRPNIFIRIMDTLLQFLSS